jgi:outer membrane scaffolding protein for murein synthesis (MipA/OmpV family)
MKMTFKTIAIVAVSVCVLVGPAAAGGRSDSGLELQVGGVVAVSPKFEGSKDYEVVGFPIVAPAGSSLGDGLVQFRGPDDVRLRLLRAGKFEAGPLAGWRFSRVEDDASRFAGLGDVEGGLVAGAYAAYKAGRFTPFVS